MQSTKLNAQLSGIFVPICTPFNDDESLDLASLRFNLETYATTELKGYLALGSNGENKSLTEEEKLTVLETIVAHKGEGQVVMAGATYEAQRDTERFLRLATATGADFGVVLPPSYFRDQMTDEVLYRYYATVADSAPLPIVLYNAPKFCGVTLSPELVGRLAEHPNIVGMKDSASSGFEAFLQFASDSFLVMAGSVSFLFPAMMAGAVGGTVSMANAFPAAAMELYACGAARDAQRGPAMQEKNLRINKATSGKHGVAGVKAAMDLAGLRGGIPRRPLLPLNGKEVQDLRNVLVAEGLL
jgi:4-hydroxy-2-oxoglutarate aldolase